MSVSMAIDPGPHCGIAVHVKREGEIDEYKTLMLYEDIPGVLTLVRQAHPAVLVIERFATGGRIDWNGLYTVNLVGQLQGYVGRLNETTWAQATCEIRLMTPGSRRAFMPEAKAMKITVGPHELDALCHLLRYEFELRKGTLKRVKEGEYLTGSGSHNQRRSPRSLWRPKS